MASFCRLLKKCRSLASLGMTIHVQEARRSELRAELSAKAFEIDAAIEAQTQEETLFDCCLRGNRRYRMRLAIHVGVERIGGCEAEGLVMLGRDTVGSYRESGVTGAAGSCRAALGLDGRGRPSPH